MRWSLVSIVSLFFALPIAAQPTMSKTFTPSTIGTGGVSTATFTIINGSGSPVADLAFTDLLPASVTIADPANASTDCRLAIGGSLSAPDGGNSISLMGGLLGGFETCQVWVNVTSPTAGTYTNPAVTLSSSAGSSMSTAVDLTVATDRPAFSKSFSPSTVDLGERSTLTFTVDNSANPSALSSLVFIDDLPVGMVVADPSNLSTTCGGPNPQASAPVGGSSVSFQSFGLLFPGFEVILAGETCTLTVDVVATSGGMLDNVSSDLTSNVGSSGRATDTLEVLVADLNITKRFVDDPVPPGATVRVEFGIFNRDRSFSATDLAFTDDLDAALSGLMLDSVASNDCGGTVMGMGTTMLSLVSGSIPPEGTCTIEVDLVVPAGAAPGNYVNTTSAVTATVGGSSAVGNAASDTLFVSPAPVLTKSFLNNPYDPGDPVVVEFTVTNTSSTSSATDIAFEDPFPTVLPTASVLPGNDCCGMGSMCSFTPLFNPAPPSDVVPGTLMITGGTLAPAGMAGDSCTFQITLDLTLDAAPGLYDNVTSEITATVDGATRTGEAATDTLEVVSAPILSKSFLDDPVVPGDQVTLEFVLSHPPDAATTATGITFTDDLASVVAGLTASLPPSPDPPCGPGSTLTASAGNTLLTLSGGTLNPGEQCVFSVTLDVDAATTAGTYTNTTSGVAAMLGSVPTTSGPASAELIVTGLTLTKEFIDDPVLPGQTVTLRFTLDNSDPAQDATSISFTDDLSFVLPGVPDLTINTPLPLAACGGSLSTLVGTFLFFSGGSALAGDPPCTFDLSLTVPAGIADGSYGNATGSITAVIGGSPVVLPPATDFLDVNSTLLQLTKEFRDDPVAPGDPVTLRFEITNLDAVNAATDLAFVDDLGAVLPGLAPTGLPFAACGGTVEESPSNVVSFSGGNLAPGASCQFDVMTAVPGGTAAGTYPNTTSGITGQISGLDVSGTPATDELDVLNLLTFTKAFDGPTTATGTATLTFTITNPGVDPVSAIAFTDDLDAVVPGLVAIGLPANPCGASSSITGTGFLSFSGGELPPMGGMCSFSFDVFVPVTATAGSFPNVTSELSQNGLTVSPPAMDNLVIEPPPTFSKVFSGNPIFAGLTSTLTFTIDNSASTLAANDLAFVDNLPAGLIVATPSGATNTCGGTLGATAGSTSVELTTGAVGAGATCTASVTVLAPAPGSFMNTTGDLTSTSGNSGAASDTLTVTSSADISVTKSDGVTSAVAGTSVTYTIVAANAGPSADPAVGLTDTFPAQLTCTYTSVAAGGASGNTAAGAGDLAETLSMPAGSSVSYTAICAIDSDATGTLSNTATATASVSDPMVGNNSATDNDTVLSAEADLSVTKDDGVTSAVPGQDTIVYAITVANAGPSDDASVSLADTFPADLTCTYTSVANGGATGNTTAGAGDLAETLSLPTGSSVDYTASCDIDPSAMGTLSNTATVTASVSDPDTGNNTATDNDTVLSSETDLSIVKDDGGVSGGVAPGGSITYGLTVTNNGPSDSTGATVTDVLPPGLSFLSSADCSEAAGTVTCAVGALASGSSAGLTFDATVLATPTAAIVNTATVSANEADGTSANDSSTVTTNLVPLFTKAFSDVSVALGEQSTLTFTIDNAGSTVDATALAFTDNLPVELEVSALPATVNGCGGTLTAVAGSTVITLTGGMVGAGATCTIDVGVLAVAIGTANNVTSTLTSSLGSSAEAMADLDVTQRPTSTAVDDETVPFSETDQPVTLTATVSSTVPVDQGTVTFSVFDGVTPVGTPVVSGTVAAGIASAVLTLPGTTPAGSYTIEADYSGGPEFIASMGTGTLTVEETLPGDKDGDGVDSLTEDGAPNGGDGNDDGIADRFQTTVTSLPSATTGDYLTLVSNGPGCRNELVQALDPADFPADATAVISYAQIQGLLGFELACPAAEVTVIYHGENDLGAAEYRKYGPTPTDPRPHWYTLDAAFATAVVDTATVATATFDLVDGAEGDHDLVVDGRIVDPGGAAIEGVGIPTAGAWALILLSLALAGTAVGVLRLTR